ncbi:MAG TPA: tRNA-dihydrouridine synthase family protein, partial [Deinococcales bacterium]|nr:tRNA-dihydrouridine synthase family protein [Deinococcales bacterium]
MLDATLPARPVQAPAAPFFRERLSRPGAVLAPMAGFTDAPFRMLCREAGALWAVTEMVSSLGIVYTGKKSFQVGEPYPGEPDLVIQVFGSDPAAMGEAGAMLVDAFHPAALDINMGCPVPKVVKGGGGSCLLRTPELAHDVTAALVRAVP